MHTGLSYLLGYCLVVVVRRVFLVCGDDIIRKAGMFVEYCIESNAAMQLSFPYPHDHLCGLATLSERASGVEVNSKCIAH